MNYSRAAEVYQQAADSGEFMSAVKLAQLLKEDYEDLPRDLERATEMSELGVELAKEKVREAVYVFCKELLAGQAGLRPDAARAAILYEIAADGGCAEAKRELGILLMEGEDELRADVGRAVQLFEEAIDEISSIQRRCCILESFMRLDGKDSKKTPCEQSNCIAS